MANIDHLNAKRDLLMGLDPATLKEPTVPIDAYVQEAEDLYQWAIDDQVALDFAGINAQLLNDLPVRAGACREAQSLWNKEYRTSREAEKQWKDLAPQAYDLRDQLLHAFRYAYRNLPEQLNSIALIAEGTGHADMIQDLNDLAVLGRSHTQALTDIGFDLGQLDTAALQSVTMATLLAEINGLRNSNNEAKMLRDRAFTHLKELVDQLRSCGKYVFWKNPERLKGYSSNYWKRTKKKAAAEANQKPADAKQKSAADAKQKPAAEANQSPTV